MSTWSSEFHLAMDMLFEEKNETPNVDPFLAWCKKTSDILHNIPYENAKESSLFSNLLGAASKTIEIRFGGKSDIIALLSEWMDAVSILKEFGDNPFSVSADITKNDVMDVLADIAGIIESMELDPQIDYIERLTRSLEALVSKQEYVPARLKDLRKSGDHSDAEYELDELKDERRMLKSALKGINYSKSTYPGRLISFDVEPYLKRLEISDKNLSKLL